MKINTVLNEKETDVGISNIEIEGEVTYTEVPEHRISPPDAKKEYDFWSQFVVIDDGTGKIGCSVSVKDKDDGITKGAIARVKGKLTEWQGKRKIQGKLIAISKGGKVTDVQQERAEEYFEEKAKEEKYTIPKEFCDKRTAKNIDRQEKVSQAKANVEDNKWEARDLRIARECAVKAVTELVTAKIMEGKDFFRFADTIVKYIYNGHKAKKVKLPHDDKGEPLEVINDELLFPEKLTDKEIEEIKDDVDKEEMVNSFNNPIPFKGKRKKVSVAADFLAPADMPD